MGSGVEQVGPRVLCIECTHCGHAPEHRHERCGSVDHCGVDHLTAARPLRLKEPANDSVGEEHSTATEVADEIEWGDRARSTTGDVRKCATESDVVNVVAGCLGVRAGLAPSGHSTEDEFRIALVTHIGADTESLHHARPKTFNQSVGSFDEVEKNRNTFRVFEVEGDALSTPQQHITYRSRRSGFHRLCSIDTNHFGSHIRQHHCGEGAWPNSGNFKDSISAEWS